MSLDKGEVKFSRNNKMEKNMALNPFQTWFFGPSATLLFNCLTYVAIR